MNKSWRARWIWADVPSGTPNVYVETRKTFRLAELPERALLRITANQEYEVLLNGERVGRGPSPSDDAWKYYDTRDVGSLLVSGRNVIAIIAYNFGTADIVTEQRQGPGGVLAQLDISDEQGGSTECAVATDGTWTCRRSPRWVANVSRQHQWNGFREVYLADKEDGWELPEYDDSAWPGAIVVAQAEEADSPWPRLLERDIPFLREGYAEPAVIVRTEDNFGTVRHAETLLRGQDPGSQGSPAGGGMIVDAGAPGAIPAVVFDFGRVTAGYVRLSVEAPEGGVIQLHYGESLDMALYDTFLLKKGLNVLTPFDRRAFRFMKLTFQALPVPVRVTECSLRSVHYDFSETGAFVCSDPLLNEIWQVGLYTTTVNSQDHLEDCTLRERALWVADAVVMAKVIYHAFGDTKLMRKCLLQGARIQHEDGAIPGTGPERNGKVLPDFCAHWLFGVSAYWSYTKDRAFLDEIWPAVMKLMDWFERQEDSVGLFARADRRPWWCFIDWADYLDKRDRVTALNCFYYKALMEAAVLAGESARGDLAERWRERADRLRHAIRTRLWSAEKGAFADCRTEDGLSDVVTAQTNFTAMWTGVMEEADARRFLLDVYDRGATRPLKGAFFYHIVLETMFDRDRGQDALAIMRAYWGEMLARGATTWWETFDPQTPHGTIPSPYQGNTPTFLRDNVPVSLCHGWGAAPTYLLTQRVLGIDVSELGQGLIRFRPNPGNLEWARGEAPTIWGAVHAEWSRKEGGGLQFRASVPTGLRWTYEGDAGDTVEIV
ncbi:family 78 glycoside hydrolase catalytic domain [Paenibacillus sp. MBLB4367]|uniref:family 78 glycoside hydrolase catalytic domain n=1 Tax=Paenibacillus sp. MBLB4367 TaxID=3384767 RepID=UPI00390841D4